MRIAKVIKGLLLLACVGLYGYSAIDVDSERVHNVSIDMSMPVSIVWPFEVAVVGDTGERGLRIGPKIGRGWVGEAGGEATYKFYVPEDGRYHIWAYCLWFDVCSNAVFAKINGLDKTTLGNDPLYSRWHWVRGFEVDLKKGTHTLMLSNHSDNIALQKVLFTNSNLATPEDCKLVFSDIFYEGFDGCDHGNFSSWEIIGGTWWIQEPKQQVPFPENSLVGKSKEPAFIVYRASSWSNYALSLAVRSAGLDGPDRVVSISFGVKNVTDYHQLRWYRIDKTSRVKMQICRKTADEQQVLSTFECLWDETGWHQVEIGLSPNDITVRVDKGEPVVTSVRDQVAGGIGLGVEGGVTAFFDDIHVRYGG
jgi:hypothetical protein